MNMTLEDMAEIRGIPVEQVWGEVVVIFELYLGIMDIGYVVRNSQVTEEKQLSHAQKNKLSWQRESLNVTAAEAEPGRTGDAEAALAPRKRDAAETAANLFQLLPCPKPHE
jgi:hypothetical protein